MTLRRVALPATACTIVTLAVLTLVPASQEPKATPRATPDPGRAVYAKLGCGSCHRLAAAGSTADLGPDLDERVKNHTATSLRKVIADPPGRYSMMPDDFDDRTTDAELDTLVRFLLEAKR